jgi:hypothetical protein
MGVFIAHSPAKSTIPGSRTVTIPPPNSHGVMSISPVRCPVSTQEEMSTVYEPVILSTGRIACGATHHSLVPGF